MDDITFNWPTVLCSLAVLTASFLLGTAVLVAAVIALPSRFFQAPDACCVAAAPSHPLLRWAWRITRNGLGVLAIVIGCVLAIPGVPGPGLPIVLAGLMLADIPGKRRAIHWLLSIPTMLKSMNSIRARCGRPPLVIHKAVGNRSL